MKDYQRGTRALFAVSLLDEFTIETTYRGVGELDGPVGLGRGACGVKRGSKIDQAVRGGTPVPFIIAIRSIN